MEEIEIENLLYLDDYPESMDYDLQSYKLYVQYREIFPEKFRELILDNWAEYLGDMYII